jgi:glucosamine--fructose-6-phosphate aminotransferase (isomerizing)
MNGELMLSEIAEQPAAWRRQLEHREEIAALGRRLVAVEPRAVIFLARGTSDHAALFGKYLVETVCGIPTGSFSPSVVTLYGARPDFRGTLMIAVSQSGGSPDLVETLRIARQSGAVTVAVVNEVDSDLARAAEFVIDVRAGLEVAVAATKSYTAELLALYLLIHGMAGIPADGVDELPGLADALLDSLDLGEALRALEGRDRVAAIGRGYSLASALETSLKLMETNSISAQGFSTADFQHGPIAMIGPRMPLLIFSGSRGFPRGVAQSAVDAGAPVIVIGSNSGADGSAVQLPDDLPAGVRPILEIIPTQRLALALARGRGLDPDQPRGLLKVTETR